MMMSPQPSTIDTADRSDKALMLLAGCVLTFSGFLAGREMAIFGNPSSALPNTLIVSVSILGAGSLIAAAILAVYRQKAFHNMLDQLDQTGQAIARADAAAAHFQRLKSQINQQKTLT